MALLLVLSAGLATRESIFAPMREGGGAGLQGPAAAVYRGFSAPYRGPSDEGNNGFRRFPLSLPFDSYDNGNGAAQTHHYRALLTWQKPVHFIWGCADDVFTEVWGREWASRLNASFDGLADAAHFLQNTHGPDVARLIVARAGEAVRP